MRGVIEVKIVIEDRNEGEDTTMLEASLPRMLMYNLGEVDAYRVLSVEVTRAFAE